MAEASALADEAVRQIVGEDEPVVAAGPDESDSAGAAPEGNVAIRAARAGAAAAGGKPRRPEDMCRILSLEVPVIVQLAERTLPLSEIINLTSGAIIEFEKPADSPLDLMINNKCIGKGQAVKVGENFGLRVNTIGSVRDRIQAMRE